MRSKLSQFPELEPPLVETTISEEDEKSPEKSPRRIQQQNNSISCKDNYNQHLQLGTRYSYRAAIHSHPIKT